MGEKLNEIFFHQKRNYCQEALQAITVGYYVDTGLHNRLLQIRYVRSAQSV